MRWWQNESSKRNHERVFVVARVVGADYRRGVGGDAMKPKRPAMRYHGGKWRLADWIISHFPKHRIYVDIFGGAASVLLQKPRSYAEIYNDLDSEIVNVFRVLRDAESAEKLQRVCELTPFAREEFELAYVLADDPIEQARRTIFRSFAGHGSAAASGYNTGFRANATRSHTTPAHDWRGWACHIASFTERLRGVIIENRDWRMITETHNRFNTLWYVDPPYLPETRTTVTSGGKANCYRHEMTFDDHVELLSVLQDADSMVILSGYDSELYSDMLGDWKRVERDTHGDGRSARTEVLWINAQAANKAAKSIFQTALI